MSTETRAHAQIPGHGLQREGRAVIRNDRGDGWLLCAGHIGRGLCSCGEASGMEWTNAARKRWHRDHKALVLAALEAEGVRG